MGYEIMTLYPRDAEARRALYGRLATEIDWRRDAPLWQQAKLVLPVEDDDGQPRVDARSKEPIFSFSRGRVPTENAQRLVREILGLPGPARR